MRIRILDLPVTFLIFFTRLYFDDDPKPDHREQESIWERKVLFTGFGWHFAPWIRIQEAKM